jgi:hypothetical protein
MKDGKSTGVVTLPTQVERSWKRLSKRDDYCLPSEREVVIFIAEKYGVTEEEFCCVLGLPKDFFQKQIPTDIKVTLLLSINANTFRTDIEAFKKRKREPNIVPIKPTNKE